MLIERKEYDNVAFHRVIKNVLVQSGTLSTEKGNLNYAKIGNGKSKYGTINTETDNNFDFEKVQLLWLEHMKETQKIPIFYFIKRCSTF